MIQFRLRSAGLEQGQTLFSPGAIRTIYQFTQGYPRQISSLCHNALEGLVIHDKRLVDEEMIQELMHDESRWFHEAAA